VGEWLAQVSLPFLEGWPTDIIRQWRRIDHVAVNNPVAAVGLSVLYAEYPFQVSRAVTDILSLDLCNHSLKSIPELMRRAVQDYNFARVVKYRDLSNEHEYKLFPNAGSVAGVKTNIYFTDAWADLLDTNPGLCSELNSYGPAMAGMNNNQATGVLLLAATLRVHTKDAASLAVRLVADGDGAKDLTNVLKAIGSNSTALGAILVEGQCLRGRGVGAIDLREDALSRCDARVDVDLAHFPDDILKAAITSILDEELDMSFFDRPSVSEFWSSRWAWCVNGSHNRHSEELLHGESVIPASVPDVYRRCYVESLESNPVDAWQGVSIFTPSSKYEHGKVRAIYSCDSDTYINFEYVLRQVELAWRGRRVILNPGKSGHVGLCARLNGLRGHSGVNVMMDYDNFNSAHSLHSQRMLFEVLCERTGLDVNIKDRILSSFLNSYVSVPGVGLCKLRGTLMSGHRATSFINSVLNRAYLLCACPSLYECKSMHVGDDIYISAPSLEVAAQLMNGVRDSPLRMNPLKQSIGFVCAEFLRTAITQDCARGYACRSISSIISGNWVTKFKLGAREALESLVGSAWTLFNRSGHKATCLLLRKALNRLTGIPLAVCEGLVVGQIALGNGPVRHGHRIYQKLVIDGDALHVPDLPKNLPINATLDYLSLQTTEVERMVFNMLHVSPTRVMAASSYAKSFAGDTAAVNRVEYHLENFSGLGLQVGLADVRELTESGEVEGVMHRYPLVCLYRNALGERELARLLLAAGVEVGPNIVVQCWGGEAHGVIVDGAMTRSDAQMLSRRTLKSVFLARFPVYY
jgi:hypothetical protein